MGWASRYILLALWWVEHFLKWTLYIRRVRPFLAWSGVQLVMALILAVNAGSSSLKISLYGKGEDDPVKLILAASISSISSPPAKFSFAHSVRNQPIDTIHDHASAFEHFLDRLKKEASIDRSQIRYICHRVVHGGDYTHPVQITEEAYHHIKKVSGLAPL